MVSIKLKFRASSMPDGEGRLYYQISCQRSVRNIDRPYQIYTEEWDKRRSTIRTPGTAERRGELELLKSKIEWEIEEMTKAVAENTRRGMECDADYIAKMLDRLPRAESFFEFTRRNIALKREAGRMGTAKAYACALRSFALFRNGKDLMAASLTADIIGAYEAWLRGRGMKRNSSSCYLRTLRTLYLRAAECGLATRRDIFKNVYTGFAPTPKRAIPLSGIKAVKRLCLPARGSLAFARDMFLFSFYMQGMAFVDMAFLRKADLRNGIVSYSRRKTRQTVEVAWMNEMQEIVDRYAGLTTGCPYLLPIITRCGSDERRQYELAELRVNRNLKRVATMAEIRVPLTTYVARHSWASLARDMGVPLSVISKGMGHESLRTTQIYLSSISNTAVEQANRLIVGRVRE